MGRMKEHAMESAPEIGPLFAYAPRARATDPATSHEAATAAESFLGDHCRKIVDIMLESRRPLAAEEVADLAGGEWTAVHVAKRWSDLIDAGLVRRTDQRHVNRSGRSAFKHELV